MSEKYLLLNDYILIEPDKDSHVKSDDFDMPSSVKPDINFGIVKEVGSMVTQKDRIKVGLRLMYLKHAGRKYKDLIFIRESELITIID